MKSTVAAGIVGCVLMLFPEAMALAAEGAAAPFASDPAVARGAATFKKYCVLCHGENADGSGVAAKVYTPRPANLTISPYSDEYKTNIIRDGGEAVGRSPSMPPWGKELNDAEIKDIVVYLRTIKVKQVKDSKAP